MAVRVKLLNNHVLGKKGDVLNVPIPKANYLIRCGVAKKYVEKPKAKKATVKTKKDEVKSANNKTKPKH